VLGFNQGRFFGARFHVVVEIFVIEVLFELVGEGLGEFLMRGIVRDFGLAEIFERIAFVVLLSVVHSKLPRARGLRALTRRLQRPCQ